MANDNNLEVLNEQRKKFIDYFLLCNSVTRAARKAGVTRRTGHNWLNNAEIKEEIARRVSTVVQTCDITLEECMNELAKIAFFDHKTYATNFEFDIESGQFGCTLEEWDNIDTSALQEISHKVSASGIPYIVFKPYDKVQALKELMNRIEGTSGDKHLHLHLDKEQLKNKSAQEVASEYQQLVKGSLEG